MSLLLDALKEAEKSRQGHKEALPDTTPASEERLDLDLELAQPEDTATDSTGQSAAELPPTETVSLPTEPASPTKTEPSETEKTEPDQTSHSNNASGEEQSNDEVPAVAPHTKQTPAIAPPINNARVAADVFQNQEHKSTSSKSRLGLLLLLLIVVLIGLVAMYFLLLPQDESSFSVPSTKSIIVPQTTGETTELSTSTTKHTSVESNIATTKTVPTVAPADSSNINSAQTSNANQQNTTFANSRYLEANNQNQASSSNKIESTLSEKESVKNSNNGTTQVHTKEKVQTTDIDNKLNANTPLTATKTQQDHAQNKGIKISKRQLSAKTERSLSAANQAHKQGDYTSAEQAYRETLKQSPNNTNAALGLASLLMQRGMTEEAKTLYLGILQKDPENLQAKAALINVDAADPKNLSAGSQLKQLIIEHPKHAYLHASLGNFHARRNDWRSAQAAYFEAFSLDNKNSDYAFNLAVSLDQINKPDIAANYYEKALELSNPTSQFNPADIERRLEEIRGTTP